MSKVRLFEFEDLGWFPRSIRDHGTDLLRSKWELGRVYAPIVPRLRNALAKTGSQRILDLGSGGGGPVIAIYEELARSGLKVRITLTDKFPNLAAFTYAKERTKSGIDFLGESIDATAVPPNLDGFRTMFAALHHFPPHLVRGILQDAVTHRRPMGLFDFSSPPIPPPPLLFLMGTPLGVLLTAPFVRPFRWSRLFWTYIIPVLPLSITWDAQVSALRLYSVRELRQIVGGLPPNDYTWEIGRESFPRSITYLIGYPSTSGA